MTKTPNKPLNYIFMYVMAYGGAAETLHLIKAQRSSNLFLIRGRGFKNAIKYSSDLIWVCLHGAVFDFRKNI